MPPKEKQDKIYKHYPYSNREWRLAKRIDLKVESRLLFELKQKVFIPNDLDLEAFYDYLLNKGNKSTHIDERRIFIDQYINTGYYLISFLPADQEYRLDLPIPASLYNRQYLDFFGLKYPSKIIPIRSGDQKVLQFSYPSEDQMREDPIISCVKSIGDQEEVYINGNNNPLYQNRQINPNLLSIPPDYSIELTFKSNSVVTFFHNTRPI